MQPQVQMALPLMSRELAEVDAIVTRAVAAGDPLIASEYGNQLSKEMTLKGVALAKLFFGMRDNWPLFRAAGIEDDFKDFVDAHMHVTGRTADRYADMYEAVFEKSRIAPQVKSKLLHKPIKTLLLLTAAVREGSLTSEQLGNVIVLNHSGVRDMVREARGEVTNSSTATRGVLVQREHSVYVKGTLVVYGGSGDEIEVLGWLNLTPKNDSAMKFLERMKNALQLEDIR
jgi:hypothetical protein